MKKILISIPILMLVSLILGYCPDVSATERLILVGGGARPVQALKKFVHWAGGQRAPILIITWATQSPDEAFQNLKTDFADFSQDLRHAETAPLDAGKKQSFLKQIKSAGGIFFSGGDQNRIMDVLQDNEILRALLAQYESGVVFGGTSAGTAIAAKIMMTGEADLSVINGSTVKTREGLGLLENVILDQHFIVRQRENRLFGLMLDHPDKVGLGVDEGMAVAIEDQKQVEVFGPTQVMKIQVKDQSLILNLFKSGEKFQLF